MSLFYIFPLGSTLTYLYGPFFSFTAGCPHTVSPYIQHLLTLLHPMWGLTLLSASMSSSSLSLPSMSSFLLTIFLPHSGVPSQCFIHLIFNISKPSYTQLWDWFCYPLLWALLLFLSLLWALFCRPFFSLTAGCPHTVSPHIQHLITLSHPMCSLFMSSTSMSSPSLPLSSMSSFLKTIFFSLTAGRAHTVSPHIQHLRPSDTQRGD